MKIRSVFNKLILRLDYTWDTELSALLDWKTHPMVRPWEAFLPVNPKFLRLKNFEEIMKKTVRILKQKNQRNTETWGGREIIIHQTSLSQGEFHATLSLKTRNKNDTIIQEAGKKSFMCYCHFRTSWCTSRH